MRVRRWFAHRFLTRTRFSPDPFGRDLNWHVERPDWWDWGCSSGVTDATPEAAKARLDEWQDESYLRQRVRRTLPKSSSGAALAGSPDRQIDNLGDDR